MTGFTAFAGKVFAGQYGGGVFVTDNRGSSWSMVNNGITDIDVFSINNDGRNLYAGSDEGYLFVSTDTGNSWIDISSGLPRTTIMSIAFQSGKIYLAMLSEGVWKSDSSIINTVSNNRSEKDFVLFPNPVNTNDAIHVLNDLGKGELTISDLTGKIVYRQMVQSEKSIIGQQFSPGIYIVKIDSELKQKYQKLIVE